MFSDTRPPITTETTTAHAPTSTFPGTNTDSPTTAHRTTDNEFTTVEEATESTTPAASDPCDDLTLSFNSSYSTGDRVEIMCELQNGHSFDTVDWYKRGVDNQSYVLIKPRGFWGSPAR